MGRPVWLLASTFEPRGRSLYTLRLAEHLPKLGFDPIIFCESAAHVPDKLRSKYAIHEIPRLTNPLIRWLSIRRIDKLVGGARPALLHAQRRQLDTLALQLADRFKCPYLLTVHDVLSAEAILRLLPERLGALIAVSPSVRRDLIEGALVPEDIVHTIPAGVEVSKSHRDWRPPSAGDIPIVGCASPLEASKGLTYLLMAAELILSSGADVEFVIAGSGPEEETLRRAAQHLEIANRVTFATHIRQYRPILDAFDVFVLPSLEQGIGSIMLEAMALGKPVVATHVGGVADFVVDGEHALLVPKANHVLLAEKIQFLLDNPERARRLGNAGRDLVRLRFHVEQMAAATARLYEQVLAGQPRPSKAV